MQHQSVASDFPTKPIALAGRHGPVRIIVMPTLSGRKWRASLDGNTLCVSASPLVAAARLLIAKGCRSILRHRDVARPSRHLVAARPTWRGRSDHPRW